jgi:hypothetical protein
LGNILEAVDFFKLEEVLLRKWLPERRMIFETGAD